jgi:hypothetical protein
MPNPSTPDPDDQTATDWARPLYEQQIAMLSPLAQAGLSMALALERQVKAAEEADTPAPPAVFVAFARVSRAVRVTLMLQARLIKELQGRDRMAESEARSDVMQETEQRKAYVESIVERIAERGGAYPHEVERLVQETADRLDRDDLYGNLMSRPVSELVAMICKDLGLEVDWPELAQEAWAREEMERGTWPCPNPAHPGDCEAEARSSQSRDPGHRAPGFRVIHKLSG